MTNETFKNIEKLESDLWEAADNLRAKHEIIYCHINSGEVYIYS